MKKDIDATTGSHENSAHQGVCPNCGYCPHCGRSNAQPYRPVPYPVLPYPVVPWQPWRPYQPVWIASPQTWTNSNRPVQGLSVQNAAQAMPSLAAND